ncbi:unnamed protein product [Haemonchus placei]|uniref:Rhodanese domain-containing protein n=1 Tax=Haemonchus placei TaxID=6290 RepID=A0A0N4W5X6_HAEPC|nr:unnamed protein product [Haemonchus placei]
MDVAFYPSEYERFALYPPDVFQEYIQMLGIDAGEHLILYARGMFGGMLHASKFAWLFKVLFFCTVAAGAPPGQCALLPSGLVRLAFTSSVGGLGVTGTHIPGFKCVPAGELVEEGRMRSNEDIRTCGLLEYTFLSSLGC